MACNQMNTLFGPAVNRSKSPYYVHKSLGHALPSMGESIVGNLKEMFFIKVL